jgi:uncharacterized protein (DUF433 family)
MTIRRSQPLDCHAQRAGAIPAKKRTAEVWPECGMAFFSEAYYNYHKGRRSIMGNGLIISDPKIMMGKPVIAGTRITVELILEKLAAGETVEQILEAHPRLTRESIQAALAFAAEALRADVVYPFAGATA